VDTSLFKKIIVAFDESPEAGRALDSAMALAHSLGSALHTVTVVKPLPPYMAYAEATDLAVSQVIEQDHIEFYEGLRTAAQARAAEAGLQAVTHLVDGSEIESIVSLLREQRADLLVLGLHNKSLYIARLWSTVYELAQQAPCSVLGVH
jgi:nucleotide-binding universal stress UspA family protein